MPDVLAARLLKTGEWRPGEYKLLLRSNMDGSDTVDRQRRRQRGSYEDDEELYQWYDDQHVSPADTWAAWHTGCSEIGFVGRGCANTCPVCTGSHYETEEDRIPLTFWRD